MDFNFAHFHEVLDSQLTECDQLPYFQTLELDLRPELLGFLLSCVLLSEEGVPEDAVVETLG